VGSLVLRDVEPYTIVAGNPAKVIRTIPRPGEQGGEHSSEQSGGQGTAPDRPVPAG
jgi:serine acetyltransferase